MIEQLLQLTEAETVGWFVTYPSMTV